jgi:hypothetical protein
MDKTVLVDRDIEDGRSLLSALDRAGFPVEAAYWFYFAQPDLNYWRLLLATPKLDEIGLRATYAEILSVLETLPADFGIRLGDISPMSPRAVGVSRLRHLLPSGVNEPGTRLTGTGTRHVYLDDLYIYRLPPTSPEELGKLLAFT